MRVTYSEHAVSRMIERNISITEVASILSKPDGKIKQSQDKWIYYKKLSNRKDNLLTAVAVDLKRDTWEIITVLVNFEVKK